jgi:hypothetical protein
MSRPVYSLGQATNEQIDIDVLRAAMRRALSPFHLSNEHVGFVVDTLVATSLAASIRTAFDCWKPT